MSRSPLENILRKEISKHFSNLSLHINEVSFQRILDRTIPTASQDSLSTLGRFFLRLPNSLPVLVPSRWKASVPAATFFKYFFPLSFFFFLSLLSRRGVVCQKVLENRSREERNKWKRRNVPTDRGQENPFGVRRLSFVFKGVLLSVY